jgi:hypothetical protein
MKGVNKMKKLVFILIALLCLFLFACDNKQINNSLGKIKDNLDSNQVTEILNQDNNDENPSELESELNKAEEVNKSETEVTDSSDAVQGNENISELTGELNQTEEIDNSDVIKHKEITLYDEKLINDARLKYLELFVYPRIPDASINDVYLYQFLGTYNDYLVGVFIYKNNVFLEKALSFTISEYTFEYSDGYDILVYHDHNFYTLLEAYDNKFITYDDLSIIYRIYNEPLEKLLGFKVEANNEIASCFEALVEDDYSEENWNEINEIFLGSKELISIQKSKYDIEYVKNKVICEMMSIRPKELTKEFLSKCFDLDEEKYIWKNEGDEDFTDDLIIVLLKKPIYYIELDLSVFGLDNAIEIEYVRVTPPDSFYARDSLRLDNFRQIVFIHLEPLGKEKVIESIRKLEELEFVLCAEPNYIFKLCEEKSEDNNNIENTELTNETITSEVVAHRLSSLSANMSEVRTSEEFDDMNLKEEINKIEEDILKMSLKEFELFYKHYTMISFKLFRIIKFDDNLIIIAEMSDEEGVTKVEIFENVIPTNESILELAEGMDVYQIMKITGFPTAITTTTQEKRFNFQTDTNDPYKVVFDNDFKFIKVEPWIIDHGSIARVVSDKCDPENVVEASKAVLIKVDMTFEEVVEILGKPIAEFGSGAIWYEWNLDDQTKLQIQFRPSSTEDNNLYVLRIVDKE